MRINLYKDKEITIEVPKGYMNIGVSNTNYLIGDNNNSAMWDAFRFPLPPGDWSILRISPEGKFVTLIHKARKRTFSSPWF